MTPARASAHSRMRRAALWVARAYAVTLGFIAFWPSSVDRGAQGSILSTLNWLHAHGTPTWLQYDTIEFTANIALFVPVGLLVVVLVGARFWWVGTLVGLGLSCSIELGQLVFLPGRFATINDVVANTSGALLGSSVGAVVLIWALRPAALRRISVGTRR